MTFFHASNLQRTAFAGLRMVGLVTLCLGAAFTFRPPVAEAAESESTQRLMQMFSPQIRATLDACRGRGQVDLQASANGQLKCSDGSVQAEIPLQTYLSTVSDFLAANMLLGMRDQIVRNPQFSPERLATLFNTAEGQSFLQNLIQTELLQSGMITSNSDPAPLTNQIISKLQTTMQGTNYLETLFGTETQYNQVVQSFCTAPGMPIDQAQQTVPGLSSAQLYAICVQESNAPQ